MPGKIGMESTQGGWVPTGISRGAGACTIKCTTVSMTVRHLFLAPMMQEPQLPHTNPPLSQNLAIFLVFNGFCWNRDVFERVGSKWVMGSRKNSCATNFDYSFKVLLIGDSGVGKSSLLLSFISNCQQFPRDLSPTIGMLCVCVIVILMFDSWNFWNCLFI